MQLISFSGYARSGKDEAAKALQELGFTRIAFADKLREALVALNPLVVENNYRRLRVEDVINGYGWDGYKETAYGTEIRELLQRLGTEVGRNILYENVWVDAALSKLDEDGKYVVTDCRFPNEALAVKDKGGSVIRITRTGVGPANNHPSETSLDDWAFDEFVQNDGTLEEFHEKIKRLAGAVL